MRVLVVIPTHDRVEFLEEAIASVRAQTRQPDKIVVTGNVGCGHVTDTSLATRLNDAIEQSGCDAFVMLSDDDTLAPEFLTKTVVEMESRSVDIVYTDCRVFGQRHSYGAALGEWDGRIDDNTVPLVTSLCSVTAWRRAGGHVDVPYFDWDFWWRCYYTGATAHWLREPLWNYRVHPAQTGGTDADREFILHRHEELKRKNRW
jgi:hypothetical protein